MLLAGLEIRHSRAVVPTRRVALGEVWLPTTPPPGNGGLLLAAVVGTAVAGLAEEVRDELEILIDDLQRHRRIAQPRLRHRFQTDVVGLDRSTHRLVRVGRRAVLEHDDHGAPIVQALGAVYAAGHLSMRSRAQVFRLVRRATRWEGGPAAALLDFLTSGEATSSRWGQGHDERWALRVLGFRAGTEPARHEILGRFRQLVRDVHPDHGAVTDGAGQRIHELAEAKRILLT